MHQHVALMAMICSLLLAGTSHTAPSTRPATLSATQPTTQPTTQATQSQLAALREANAQISALREQLRDAYQQINDLRDQLTRLQKQLELLRRRGRRRVPPTRASQETSLCGLMAEPCEPA